MSKFDLDDPDTWPDDLQALEALAAGDATLHPQEGTSDSEPMEALAPAVDDKPKTPEAESMAGAAEQADKPTGVATRDGQHVMPYARFEEVQQALQASMERARELEALVAANQAQTQADPEQGKQAQTEPAGRGLEDRIAAAQERYEQVREDDPELAENIQDAITAMQELKATQDQLADMRGWFDAQRQQEATQQQAQIAQAVEADPVLSAWANDPDQSWYRRAVAMDQQLSAVEGSKVASAKTWPERFAAVVEAVHAAYGPSPQLAKAPKPDGKAKTAFDAEAAELPPPPSLGAMGGGDLVSANSRDLAGLGKMSGAELLGQFRTMPADQLSRLISRVS